MRVLNIEENIGLMFQVQDNGEPTQLTEPVDENNNRVLVQRWETETHVYTMEYTYINPITHPAWGAVSSVEETLIEK
ncbi:hypothetical protein EFA69_16115 [Rufibacter immobilis]|uniref:Uncharacterized protein n=1 Tax=Rufibacter immobilis TaxID=1348778 RepID=A0A3M9MQ32_9BACT|nr:hypothetical protein [Rufibacter immobilis]RNI27642.1 hypothetical protein EFA69_16115 [Rufibacter immobilis]